MSAMSPRSNIGYAPAGPWRSLILLVSLVALAGGAIAAVKADGMGREIGLWSSVLGVLVFAVAAGSVDRVSIDPERLKCQRRKGIMGWFRPPVSQALSETRGVALGRRKLTRRSTVSWAPLLVWPDGRIHVLSNCEGHGFAAAGREVRQIAAKSGIDVLEEPEELEAEWQIVPLSLADREPNDPGAFLAEVLKRSGKTGDDRG